MALSLHIRRHAQDDGMECGPAVAQMAIAHKGYPPQLFTQLQLQWEVDVWKASHASPPLWITPPEGLANLLNGHVSAHYRVQSFVSADDLWNAIHDGLKWGYPAMVGTLGSTLHHWVLVTGTIDLFSFDGFDYDRVVRTIDPLPNLTMLNATGGFAFTCRQTLAANRDAICAVVALSSVPPHTVTDWCDVIEGDDSNPADWIGEPNEVNQVVNLRQAGGGASVARAELANAVVVDAGLIQKAITALSVIYKKRLNPIVELIKGAWRKVPNRPPRDPTPPPWEVVALAVGRGLGLVRVDAEVNIGESWLVHPLDPDGAAIRIIAVLNSRGSSGWLMAFDDRTRRFMMARRATPPILRSFRGARGTLLWRFSPGAPSPMYPFVKEADGLRRIIDGAKLSDADLR